MCLRKLHKFPRISFTPIKCYKIVYYVNDTIFTTFYRCKTYKFNIPIKHSFLNFGISKRNLTGEVVHAYINKPKFLSECLKVDKASIIECIIPPFTFYYKGLDGDVGARKLIPVKYVDVTELIWNNLGLRKEI